jgi:hypothetical protein
MAELTTCIIFFVGILVITGIYFLLPKKKRESLKNFIINLDK